MQKIRIKRNHPDAKLPKWAHDGDACGDLFSVDESVNLQPGQTKLFSTGLIFELPWGWEAQIRSRSGLSLKGISVLNSPGTIDHGYRSNVGIVLHNHSFDIIPIEKGSRIAQVAFRRYEDIILEDAEEINMETARGTGGFGSTGVR